MKKFFALSSLFAASLLLSGCIHTTRPDGWCALSVSGICLSRWQGGKTVPAGEIDMRYNGSSCSNGSTMNPDGTMSNALVCSGTTTISGREYRDK